MGIRDRLRKRLGRDTPSSEPSKPRPAPTPPPPETAGRRSRLLRAEMAEPAPPEAVVALSEPEEAPVSVPEVEEPPAARLEAKDAVVEDAVAEDAAAADAFTVRVLSPDGEPEMVFPMRRGEFVCDGADRAGLEVPSSCRSGGCIVCCGKLIEGEVEMGEQYVLEDEDIEAGYRLLCCTELHSDAVFLSHQENEVGG